MVYKIKSGDVVRWTDNNNFLYSGEVFTIFNGGKKFNVHAHGPDGGWSDTTIVLDRTELVFELHSECVICENEGYHNIDRTHVMFGQE